MSIYNVQDLYNQRGYYYTEKALYFLRFSSTCNANEQENLFKHFISIGLGTKPPWEPCRYPWGEELDPYRVPGVTYADFLKTEYLDLLYKDSKLSKSNQTKTKTKSS